MDPKLLGLIQAIWQTFKATQVSLAGIHKELATANIIRLWKLEPKAHSRQSLSYQQRHDAHDADYADLLRRINPTEDKPA